MRRFPLILGLALIVALTILDAYGFFVTNEGVRYFLSEPRRLVLVLLLSLAGGAVALGFSRLSPGSLRTLKLAALGAFGSVLVLSLCLFAYSLARFAPMVSEGGDWGWIVGLFISFSVLAMLVWFEFRQVWRQT